MIKSYFPTKIYDTKLDTKYNNVLEKRAYELREKYAGEMLTDWRTETFNTLHRDWKLDNEEDNIIKEFLYDVAQHVFVFGQEFEIDPNNVQLDMTHFWFNISGQGQGQEYHQHPNSHFSISYYIKTKPKCGNIVFKNHNHLFDAFEVPNSKREEDVIYEVNEGDLLIFKSNQLHMVENNISGEDRISCSANFTVK